MKFPSITHYIEAVSNLRERLRTARNINPVLDKSGEPLFYSSKGVVTFAVERNGSITSLRCFTSIVGYERLTGLLEANIINGELLENELFVFDNNEIGDYYSVIIQDSVKKISDEIQPSVEFVEGLTAFEKDGLWGFRDEKDEVVIKPEYDFVGEFGEGRAVVGKNGLFGLIDSTGKLVLDISFDEISWDGSAIAYVERGGKWGCYDRSARLISECKYDWMGEFSNSLLLVCKAKKYGYIDLHGTEVIPLVYDSATSFDENGIASVKICGKFVMINSKGEIEN